MKNDFRFDFITDSLAGVLTIMQSEEIFQIICLIMTIVSFAVSIGFTIYKWIKEAKKDGHISEEEIGQLIESVKEDVDKFQDNLNKGEKK